MPILKETITFQLGSAGSLSCFKCDLVWPHLRNLTLISDWVSQKGLEIKVHMKSRQKFDMTDFCKMARGWPQWPCWDIFVCDSLVITEVITTWIKNLLAQVFKTHHFPIWQLFFFFRELSLGMVNKLWKHN